MGLELVNGRTVELVFPYLSGYKPFLAIYDSRGVRIVSGGNAVRAEVSGMDYAVVKGYLAGSKPFVIDVMIGGDGARYLPALINSLFTNFGRAGDDAVTLYMLEFRFLGITLISP